MPTTSETIPVPVFLYDASGAPVAYASKAAFLLAGWDLEWQDADGVALDDQPTWTLSAGNATTGRHVVGFQPPAGVWTVEITKPTGYWVDPIEFNGKATTYDEDDLYGAYIAGVGTPITELATTGSVDLYDGNSIEILMSVLEAALTAAGATSLADCDDLTAEIKLTSKDSDDPADVDTLVCSIVSDVSGNRVVLAALDAFPTELAVPDDQDTLSARCDLRITKGAKIITAAVRGVTVRWKANT